MKRVDELQLCADRQAIADMITENQSNTIEHYMELTERLLKERDYYRQKWLDSLTRTSDIGFPRDHFHEDANREPKEMGDG